MSFSRGPNLVTDGLVLALDAGNTKSYPGSGVIVTDLSGKNNNAELINGVELPSNYFSFDGIDDYASIESLSINDDSPFSFQAWIKPDTQITSKTYAVVFTLAAQTKHWQLSYTSDNNYNILFAFAGTSTSVGTVLSSQNLISLNTWGNICAQYTGGSKSSLDSWLIYINGVSVELKLTGNTGSSSITTSLGFRPGSGGVSNNYYVGSMSNVLIYDRVLSESEVISNYNAQKNKFVS